MVLLCGNLDDLGLLVWLVKIFDANYLRDFTFCIDWETDRKEVLQLHFQKAFNDVIFLDRRDLHCDFDLCSFFLSDFESNFLKVFESLVASH